MGEEQRLDATGSVMLDIGGEIGAVVVHVGPGLVGREIEARPVGHEAHPAHAAVLERRTAAGPVYAVVISGLTAGAYTLWLDAAKPWGNEPVVVRGGEVTDVDRREATLPVAATVS